MVKRRILTREIVVQKGIELANHAGAVEKVTLKQLAHALNIKVPSLYNHVKGSDGLIQAMREQALQKLLDTLRESTFGKSGEDALLAASFAYRQFAKDNPAIYPLTQQPPQPNEMEVARKSQELVQFVSLLLPLHLLDEEEKIHAIRGFRSLLHGFVMIETSEGFGLPFSIQTSFEQLIQTYLAGLKK